MADPDCVVENTEVTVPISSNSALPTIRPNPWANGGVGTLDAVLSARHVPPEILAFESQKQEEVILDDPFLLSRGQVEAMPLSTALRWIYLSENLQRDVCPGPESKVTPNLDPADDKNGRAQAPLANLPIVRPDPWANNNFGTLEVRLWAPKSELPVKLLELESRKRREVILDDPYLFGVGHAIALPRSAAMRFIGESENLQRNERNKRESASTDGIATRSIYKKKHRDGEKETMDRHLHYRRYATSIGYSF